MNAMSNDIAAIEHPSWCSRSDCQVAEPEGGAHLSRPAQARSARTDLAVTIQLVQYQPVDGFPDSGQPFVSLVAQLPAYGPDHPHPARSAAGPGRPPATHPAGRGGPPASAPGGGGRPQAGSS